MSKQQFWSTMRPKIENAEEHPADQTTFAVRRKKESFRSKLIFQAAFKKYFTFQAFVLLRSHTARRSLMTILPATHCTIFCNISKAFRSAHEHAGNGEIWINCRQRRLVWFGIMFGTDIVGRRTCSTAVQFYVLCSTVCSIRSSIIECRSRLLTFPFCL